MGNNANARKKRNAASEFAIMLVLAACAFVSVVAVGAIVIFLFYTAIPAIAQVGLIEFLGRFLRRQL